jgi:uncharacterized LabA/DUF88 family protein
VKQLSQVEKLDGMLNTEKSISPFFIALAITGFGIFSQQPAIIGAGTGLAGGLGSTNLGGSRRKNVASADLVRLADMNRKLQALEKRVNTEIACESRQNVQIEHLTNNSIATQEALDRLIYQVQIQTTKSNLQLKAIHKAQTDNYSNRAIIAAQQQEISDRQAKIDRLNDLASSQVQDAEIPAIPTIHFLVDGNAMRYVVQDIGKIDYKSLRDKFTQGAAKVSSKFYLADVGTYGQQQFITYLEKNGFEVLLFPVVDIGGGEYKTKGDNVQIAIDAVNVSPGDRVILCGGGDADFFPVVNRLKEMEIDFTVVAYLKTTGAALKQAAGEHLVDLEAVRSECIACR